MRLRTTAFPTRLDMVKPKRAARALPPDSGMRRIDCRTNPCFSTCLPRAAAKKSALFIEMLRRSAIDRAGLSGGQLLPAAGAARRDHLAAADRRHAGAETV